MYLVINYKFFSSLKSTLLSVDISLRNRLQFEKMDLSSRKLDFGRNNEK